MISNLDFIKRYTIVIPQGLYDIYYMLYDLKTII